MPFHSFTQPSLENGLLTSINNKLREKLFKKGYHPPKPLFSHTEILNLEEQKILTHGKLLLRKKSQEEILKQKEFKETLTTNITNPRIILGPKFGFLSMLTQRIKKFSQF